MNIMSLKVQTPLISFILCFPLCRLYSKGMNELQRFDILRIAPIVLWIGGSVSPVFLWTIVRWVARVGSGCHAEVVASNGSEFSSTTGKGGLV